MASRRKVSVKDLGVVDCQGWLQRRKDSRSLLGTRWKRYWFVLKKSCLYWYTDNMAEKADGFINLSGFTIQPAKNFWKKHALSASHPQVVTIFVAADSLVEMNKWISKLSEAAEPCELINVEEGYSEDSDQDGDEFLSTSCSLDSQLYKTASENFCAELLFSQDLLQSSCSGSSCPSLPSAMLTTDSRSRSTSTGSTCNGIRRKRLELTGGGNRLSWLDLPRPDLVGGTNRQLPLIHVSKDGEEDVCPEKSSHDNDEMEHLYDELRAAHLSLIGWSGKRDFRASFFRRSHNEKINDKLHLLRILRSTLKAKESALLAVDQMLDDPTLTASAYRKWRFCNIALLEEIGRCNQATGGATEESNGTSQQDPPLTPSSESVRHSV
ncbi:interactor protein for cytohesin exchange factors 1 isoform 1-T2 [Pholidichthys leucotaenia]